MNIDMQLKNTLTLEAEQGPFISLLISFNEIPDNLAFDKLLNKVKARFIEKYNENFWNKYSKKLKRFNYSREKNVSNSMGIAIYVSCDSMHTFSLNHKTKTSAVIASTMYIMPLIKDITDECYYNLLVIKNNDFKMYNVNNQSQTLLKVPNAPAFAFTNNQKDFFKLIDECVIEKLNHDDTLPLVVVGNEDDCKLYAEQSKYSNLVSDIYVNYQNNTDIDSITKYVNEKLYQKFINNLKFNYNKAKNKSKVLTDIEEITSAAISGYIDTLMINESEKSDKQVNNLAITTIGFGGDVYLIDENDMPNNKKIIAISRI
ncbi:hypothetical protein [Apilactobacillus xinyiensis]|uniref:baeRF3 domain-containing protein n=1 Tax=Apilactobacillus xinyiensis TaxID=2841032 RepID=UPI00200E1414|nr:hypothetical protein [Apilactobacillus xinyiensis]MCL0318531.1 hypothetical protein [Apilactobacillus xinyiensis]